MFDRLVCMNGGNPREETDRAQGSRARHEARAHPPNGKAQPKSPGRPHRRVSFVMATAGGDELDDAGRPKLRRTRTTSIPKEPFETIATAYAPLVWQCRYGGIEVPDVLWRYVGSDDEKYSDNQAEDLLRHGEVFRDLDDWTDYFTDVLRAKGKIAPGRYRAFGYKAPGHFLRDTQLAWRDVRMRVGHPREGSSPDEQQTLGLNQDATRKPSKGEGEKLRE